MTVELKLTKGHTTVVDDEDADLNSKKWYAHTGKHGSAYAYRRTYVSMHRVILERKIGRNLEEGEVVDHIDGNTLNNSRANLRVATTSQNMMNRSKSPANTSGYKGVFWRESKQRWIAAIKVNGKRKYLGSFRTPEAAYEAYKKAAIEIHGEFARFE